MSITMHLYYAGKNGNARRFAEEMERGGTADLIRAEPGNEGYAYFVSMDHPETVLLVDRWKDQASLDAHHASSMMRTIIDLRKTYDLHLRAERLISDDAGIPDSDVRFINE